MSNLEAKIEIACAGCGRIQSVRKSKVISCDGYTCGLGSCKLKPDFKLPIIPNGCICNSITYAAGGFSGWIIRPGNEDELRSIERAKTIRDAGIRQLSDKVLKLKIDHTEHVDHQ